MTKTLKVAQKLCVDNIEGKYLVLAGPGTGKTFTIIQRIKKMLELGIKGEKILCLTFTDAAANEMKNRIEEELDTLSVDIDIFTYHSFCNKILEENFESFELPQSYKTMTNAISRTFIKELIDEIKPIAYRTEKNDPYYYIDTIKRQIEEIKKNRLTKEKYFKNIKENPDWEIELKNLEQTLEEKRKKGEVRTQTLENNIERQKKKIQKAQELWLFYEKYQEKMSQNRFLDFNDMINFVLDKFESDSAFLSDVANKYEYIMVDEYQDTNKNQNALVFNLTKALNSQNIFVVGDDDQIIYSFQGAKLDTIEKFLENFPDTKVICLTENMRSCAPILEVARGIVIQDENRLEINPKFSKYNINKHITSANEKLAQNSVRYCNYVDTLQEYNEIVSEIENLINSSDCPIKNNEKALSQIAVLTRTNAELAEFAKLLKQRNIPFELKDGKNIFEIKSVLILFKYMQALANPQLYFGNIFELLICPPFSINPQDFMKLKEQKSYFKTPFEIFENFDADKFIEKEKIKKFIDDFKYLLNFKNKENIKNTILEIISKTGIFAYYLESDINKYENISGLKKLLDEAKDFSLIYKTSVFEEFVEYLNISILDEIPILTDKAPVALNAIQLCTYYSSKGREFEYVYMPTLISEKWESDRNTFKSEIPLDVEEYKTEDELKQMKLQDRIKVMYVGMTRAKHTLRLSSVQEINGKAKKISALIKNIEKLLDRKTDFKYDELAYSKELLKTIEKKDFDYKKEFGNFVEARLKDKAFSPSSINTYLSCPRQYFYKYILDLEGAISSQDSLSYGSAVHGALEYAINYAQKNEQYPKIEEIIEKFKNIFKTLPLSAFEQRENMLIRGENALKNYYAQLLNTPFKLLYKTEEKIEFLMDDVKFCGIIDRIDLNQNGEYIIYDYKTGNAKKRNDIAPNGLYEHYYNQIGLYKYFFEKITGKKVAQTSFIFVEDFKNNVNLELSDEDIDEIVKKFKFAISEIKNCNFELNKESCKYCSYKSLCAIKAN